MDLSTILEISLATFAVIGFAVFAIKRSDLTKVNFSHGLDDNTRQVVQDVVNKGGDSVSRLSGVVEHVANRAGDILQPLGSGAGDILHAIAGKISQKQDEIELLKTESIALAQEVARLQNRKIDVTGMSAQIKLALLRVSQQYKSLNRQIVETNEESLIAQGSTTEYLGFYVADYQVQIGVDIEKLRFQLVPSENTIYVYGLRMLEIIGLTDLKIDTTLAEIRKFTKKGTVFSAKAEILANDSRAHEYAKKHSQQILDEIQHRQSVEHLAEPNAKFALAFLQACLSITGLKVAESTEPLDASLSFGELCLEINYQVERSIEAMSAKLLEIDYKNSQARSSMLAIARGESESNSNS